jgi:hypothetical protein
VWANPQRLLHPALGSGLLETGCYQSFITLQI